MFANYENIPDSELLLYVLKNERERDRLDYAQLLAYAVPSKEAGPILRQVLNGSRSLLAVYPGLGEKAPAGAEYLGSIMDGALYLV